MPELHLWPHVPCPEGPNLRFSMNLVRSVGAASEVWWRLPSRAVDPADQSCDAFVVAALLPAMAAGADLVVHGLVSPSLLRNLDEFQAAWTAWKPDGYRRIAIKALAEAEWTPPPGRGGAVTSFSGGVDSCYTALRHTRQTGPHCRILRAGLMIHGFDIPLTEAGAFAVAAAGSRRLLDSLGIELLLGATNFRQAIRLHWEDIFAAALAAFLLLLRNRFATGLIPASWPYDSLHFPYGSNPITDRLLTSDGFAIIHDGAGASRAEKLRALSGWPQALQDLRVCWDGRQDGRNCGRCAKCLRNLLNLRVIGIELPPCFARPPAAGDLDRLRLSPHEADALVNVLRSARAAGMEAPWMNELRACLRRVRAGGALKRLVPAALKRPLKRLLGLAA
jgi:hypothetical protein